MNENRPSVKEAILALLAKQPNQTAKQIHAELSWENPTKFPTYQAVHKALQQLEGTNSVVKKIASYSVSDSYISKLEEHLQDAKQTRNPSSVFLTSIRPGETRGVDFVGSILEPYYWLLREVDRVCKKRGNSSEVTIYMCGVWPISILSDVEYQILKRGLNKTDSLIVCADEKKNRPWDLFYLRFWAELGAKKKFTKNYFLPKYTDMLVFHDYVIQIEEEIALSNRFFQMISGFVPDKLLVAGHQFLFNEKGHVSFKIIRNAELAAHYHHLARAIRD